MKSITGWDACGIRRRALAFCACLGAMVVIAADGFGQGQETKTRKPRSEEIALQSMQNIAKAAAALLNVYMDARATETLAFSATCERLKNALANPDSQVDANRVLAEWFRNSDAYEAVLLLDKNGVCLASTSPELSNRNLSEDEAFQGAIKGSFTVSDVHRSDIVAALNSKPTGWAATIAGWTVEIAAPISNDNEVEGVLLSFMKWSTLVKLIAGVVPGESGYVYVLNRQNQVIIHPSPSLYGVSLSDPKINPPQLAEAVSKKVAYSSYEFVNAMTNRMDSKLVGFAYPSSCGNFPGLGWTVAAGADQSELIEPQLLGFLRSLGFFKE
jgi:hypothetical protein